MPRVLLVSMPYAALDRPSLGLGLLQAELRAAGIACETRYLAFPFADLIGLEDYLWVSRELPYVAFAGDWLFTASLYGPRPEADARYVQRVLREEWRLTEPEIARLLRLRAYCEPHLAHCLDAVPWGDHDVVGFTSTFEQNIASLALARRLKARHPRLLIAFGGANWEGEMGRELHRRFRFVDLVCSGEADHSFPAALAELARPDGDLGRVRGLVYRDGGESRATGPAPLVRDLDALPVPDFEPFARDHAASPSAAPATPTMLLETGRGCWWGARSHCTFCGLNGGSMAFRAKAADRALDEIRELRDRYGSTQFNVVDNILDMGYFRTLLPRLAREEPGLSFFYEVKANLSQEQVALLAAAGVRRIQPGLESLSDHVLKLMRKGTSALQNVQLLKWTREHGVRPEWNLLYGFPGETRADYAAMLDMLDAIWFLDPPSGYGAVRLDRFSPYQEDPAAWGMMNVRPMAPYPFLYPFPAAALMRIAYYFDYDHADRRPADEHARDVVAAVRRWMADDDRGGLWRLAADGGLLVVDERRRRPRRTVRLDGWQAAAYDACDRVRSLGGLRRELEDVAGEELAAFLDGCVRDRLMLRDGERYLSLAVTTPARAWTPAPAATAVAA
jgi:ribosomal peptide maturation radical SAM protein 1